ncbi:hypothetical protein FJ420_21295 [Mesorhizobium sp. B3-1-3]|uniref:DUF6634 family protein n=1 Tax=unclassified Mesorhizobium TaxID=325217 RepID=UPI00112EEC76|nr:MULTISPECIES: DUF6634 family protein [unclassified Mesorhizobium]TPI59864.1 hypothetical protein FJ424_24780 [Mesorhizobium sp. B3-1-8]TPI68224.1 hypothetical protein FJ420_21295 [Mesorhizobium sp. B3-1-3]
MMILFDGANTDLTFDLAQARLVSLLSDMERLRDGIRPEDFAGQVPLLDYWMLAQRPATCLIGLSTGHPLLPGIERQISTSDLMLMSRDREWARTMSRWYRLGRPATITGREQ